MLPHRLVQKVTQLNKVKFNTFVDDFFPHPVSISKKNDLSKQISLKLTNKYKQRFCWTEILLWGEILHPQFDEVR